MHLRRIRISLLVSGLVTGAFAQAPVSGPLKVTGVGAFPISGEVSSLWLNGASGKPLVMVYCCGKKGWLDAKWDSSSKVEPSGWAWFQLTSPATTLRVRLNLESRQLEVQGSTSNLGAANTFLVLHADERPERQRILALGTFEMPVAGNDPASLALLTQHPSLVGRIREAIAQGDPSPVR